MKKSELEKIINNDSSLSESKKALDIFKRAATGEKVEDEKDLLLSDIKNYDSNFTESRKSLENFDKNMEDRRKTEKKRQTLSEFNNRLKQAALFNPNERNKDIE